MTIDNYRQAQALMRKIKAQLPIPVRATRELARAIDPRVLKLKRNQELSIKGLFYAGDEGGILCDVTPPETRAAVVCSLTHVEIDPEHPLAEEVQAYQQARRAKLAQTDRRPGSAFIPNKKAKPRPRKRRRRRR